MFTKIAEKNLVLGVKMNDNGEVISITEIKNRLAQVHKKSFVQMPTTIFSVVVSDECNGITDIFHFTNRPLAQKCLREVKQGMLETFADCELYFKIITNTPNDFIIEESTSKIVYSCEITKGELCQ